MSDDIKPLLQDAATNDDLRRLLDAASAHEPSPPDLARLGARLSAALPPGALTPASATAPPAASAAGTGAALGKVGAALLVLAVGGGGAWLATRESVPSQAPSTVSTASPPPSDTAPVASAAPPLVVEPPPSASARATPTPAPRPTAAATVTAPPEATLLARAHAELLHGSPADALATTSEHARAYPHGSLAQEREVIAIEALVALGRRDEARQRAATFRVDYPGSSHAARIGRLLEEP